MIQEFGFISKSSELNALQGQDIHFHEKLHNYMKSHRESQKSTWLQKNMSYIPLHAGKTISYINIFAKMKLLTGHWSP